MVGSGFRDWLIQRATAIIILVYAGVLIDFFSTHAQPDFGTWQHFFSGFWMQAGTLLVLLSILWHAWIGIWTVITDYVKSGFLRLILFAVILIGFVGFIIWWGELLWR